MKFLIISKLKDSALMMPPAVRSQIVEATLAGMKQQQKEGVLLESYYSPGTMQSITIIEVDNADQWAAEQDRIPILPYTDVQTYPLADGFKNLEKMVESIKMMARESK